MAHYTCDRCGDTDCEDVWWCGECGHNVCSQCLQFHYVDAIDGALCIECHKAHPEYKAAKGGV